MYERSYGAKYDKNLGTKEIAAAFRQDVKTAKAKGELPKDLKLSVTMDRFAGGSSIHVDIKGGLGCPLFNPEWLEAVAAAGNDWNRPNSERYNPEAAAIEKKLEGMLQAYNHDGSDSQSDYFDVKLYGHVRFHWEFEKECRETEEADLKETDAAMARKAQKAGEAEGRDAMDGFFDKPVDPEPAKCCESTEAHEEWFRRAF